ncbi:MAG: hypothetical protein R2788_21700 [Saprospiraceae bacterium]
MSQPPGQRGTSICSANDGPMGDDHIYLADGCYGMVIVHKPNDFGGCWNARIQFFLCASAAFEQAASIKH